MSDIPTRSDGHLVRDPIEQGATPINPFLYTTRAGLQVYDMVAHVNGEGVVSYPQWWIPRNRYVKDVCVGARQGSGVWVFFTVDLTVGKVASTSTLDPSKPWRRVRVLVFNEQETINPVTGERSPSPLAALALNWSHLSSP